MMAPTFKTFAKLGCILLALVLTPASDAVNFQFPFSSWKLWTPSGTGTFVGGFDASTLGLSNGAAVTSWPNLFGGSAATGTGTYQTNQQNGRGTVSFNGTSNQFVLNSIGPSTPTTIAIVFTVPDRAALYPLVSATTINGIEYYLVSGTGLQAAAASYTGGIGFSSTAVPTAAYHCAVLVLSSSTYTFYMDGAAVGSGANPQSISGGTLHIGTDGSNFFKGNVAVVYVWTSLLTAFDVAKLNSFVRNEWATPP